MSMIYIARPIDHTDPQRADLLKQAETAAAEAVRSMTTMWAYHPARAYTIGDSAPRTPRLNKINNTALDLASRVLVIWPAGSTSWGVPAEVAAAEAAGTPVDIVTDAAPGAMGWAAQWDEDGPVKVHYAEPGGLSNVHAYLAALRTDRERTTTNQDTRDKLQFMQVREDEPFILPFRGHDDDAGFDLYVSQDTWVPAGEFVDIPSNTAAHIPDHTWGQLTGRSSTLRRKRLLVNPGVIDAGYRGELFAGVQNMTNEPILVKAGERVAQLIILPNGSEPFVPVQTDQFTTGATRGTNGFGSTGS